MIYTIVVMSAPHSGQSALTAYNFTKAALNRGHQIHRVFFYHDGVFNASSLSITSTDEKDIPALWQQLGLTHNLDFVVCIAAAIKRGILNQNESQRHQREGANLAEGFELSGLGQLVEATMVSDRVITFGS